MGNSLDSKIIEDQRYGAVNKFLYQNQLVIQKNFDFTQDQQHQQEMLSKCQQFQQLNHKNLIRLHKYLIENSQCQVFMEHYDNDLATEILSRQLKQNYYTESELIKFLDQIVEVGAYLQTNSQYHADIRPQNILLDPSGVPKLTIPFVLKEQSKRYYAPEQYHSQQVNNYKVSVFSLGITMLQLMTLTPMNIIYLKQGVNLSLVNELLNATAYTTKLTLRIRLLLGPSNSRPDFITLKQQLAKQGNQIFENSPRSISQKFVCKQLVRTKQHSHSPFTFRGGITQHQQQQLTQSMYPAALPQTPVAPLQSPILTPTLPQLVIQTPQKLSDQNYQHPQSSQKANSMRSELVESSPKNDLDSRILRAIQQTNETLKKNSMIQ